MTEITTNAELYFAKRLIPIEKGDKSHFSQKH